MYKKWKKYNFNVWISQANQALNNQSSAVRRLIVVYWRRRAPSTLTTSSWPITWTPFHNSYLRGIIWAPLDYRDRQICWRCSHSLGPFSKTSHRAIRWGCAPSLSRSNRNHKSILAWASTAHYSSRSSRRSHPTGTPPIRDSKSTASRSLYPKAEETSQSVSYSQRSRVSKVSRFAK